MNNVRSIRGMRHPMHSVTMLRIGGPSSGGIGNSDAKNQTTTTSSDMRVVGGDGSINTSEQTNLATGAVGSGGVLNIMASDHGAIDGALKLALAGVEGAQNLAGKTIEANGSLLTGALTMAGEQQQAFTNTVKDIKTSDVRVLVIAGLAVVGLGAAYAFRKG